MVNNKRISLFTIHLTATNRCITFSIFPERNTELRRWVDMLTHTSSSFQQLLRHRFSPLSCSCMRPLVDWKASSRAASILYLPWHFPCLLKLSLVNTAGLGQCLCPVAHPADVDTEVVLMRSLDTKWSVWHHCSLFWTQENLVWKELQT